MKLEHFAINVAEPVAMANWYVAHLGMNITFQKPTAPFMTFLADESGRIMIELYYNESAELPNYKELNPLTVHFAFVTTSPDKDKERLLAAGATLESDKVWQNGSRMIMLRDPWGVALQLCQRVQNLLLDKEA